MNDDTNLVETFECPKCGNKDGITVRTSNVTEYETLLNLTEDGDYDTNHDETSYDNAETTYKCSRCYETIVDFNNQPITGMDELIAYLKKMAHVPDIFDVDTQPKKLIDKIKNAIPTTFERNLM